MSRVTPAQTRHPALLTRDQFREGVFARDNHRCVICGAVRGPEHAAHHILERRLFQGLSEFGGYFADNGATVCGTCHIACEATDISVEEVREAAGIRRIVLPEHLYEDQIYTKWGDIIQPNGSRLRGELFWDESVQKIIAGHLHLYTHLVKAPRTWHLPWSLGVTEDDRVLASLSPFEGTRIIATRKMDGSNTSLYADTMHGRAIDGRDHEQMHWTKGFHAAIAHDIPEGWRIVGENLFARHSIAYDDLESYFLAFQIWNERNVCLGWDQSLEYFELIGVKHVDVLYDGPYSYDALRAIEETLDFTRDEGYVVRIADEFSYGQYKSHVGKFVRANHNHLHNKRSMTVVRNGLRAA